MTGPALAAAFCASLGGEIEHRLPDGGRVDCLTAEHAWEVDPSEKWAESIGQALYYALETDRLPAVLLVLDAPQSCAHLRRWRRAALLVAVPIRLETAGPRTCP